MQYPALVYQFMPSKPGVNVPGHSCKGGTFEYESVVSADEHIDALSNGWFLSLDEAMASKDQAPHVEAMRAERKRARDESERYAREAEEKAKAEREADERAVADAAKREAERLAEEKKAADDAELARMEAEEKAKAAGKDTLKVPKK